MDRKPPIWSICSLYLAMGILLLHSFIPHSHQEELVQDTTVLTCNHSERSLIDVLGVLFEHDFGEDHLEYFQLSDVDFQDTSFDALHPHVTFVDEKHYQPNKLDGYAYYNLFIHDPDIDNHTDRGPPQYS